jgi:hypothetical protein
MRSTLDSWSANFQEILDWYVICFNPLLQDSRMKRRVWTYIASSSYLELLYVMQSADFQCFLWGKHPAGIIPQSSSLPSVFWAHKSQCYAGTKQRCTELCMGCRNFQDEAVRGPICATRKQPTGGCMHEWDILGVLHPLSSQWCFRYPPPWYYLLFGLMNGSRTYHAS